MISHEVGEWMDDPITSTTDKPKGGKEGDVGGNPAPGWSGWGQVPPAPKGCQANVEVGDPLSQPPPPLKPLEKNLSNFDYHLQELAFFSWFFGGPSIGANGLFSDNESFPTDAGAVCKPKNPPSAP